METTGKYYNKSFTVVMVVLFGYRHAWGITVLDNSNSNNCIFLSNGNIISNRFQIDCTIVISISKILICNSNNFICLGGTVIGNSK